MDLNENYEKACSDKAFLAQMIDQTLLAPTATEKEVTEFCQEARKHGFASVCINPCFVETAAKILEGSETKVCTVIDFPLGAGGLDSKMAEADIAVTNGADELDYVVSLNLVKSHSWELLTAELTALVKSAKEAALFRGSDESPKTGSVILKLILETCLLSDEEIVESSKCAKAAGFDFVKTSTGFASSKPNGATVHAVSLMRNAVGNEMGVKASGGIHSKEEALSMIKAGATRIGASAGIQIISE